MPTPDFEDVADIDAQLLQDLWTDIKTLLQEHDIVYNERIATELLDAEEYGRAESYLRKRVIPALRNCLEEAGVIIVEDEITDEGEARRLWRLPGDS